VSNFGKNISRTVLTSLLTLGVMSAAEGVTDLSKYRDFQFGSNVSTVARQAGIDPSQAKVIHSRPALIQELEWRPQPLGGASRTESVQLVVFSFCDGQLFQITANYDRYETEGLTVDDLVGTISQAYGVAARSNAPVKVAAGYGDSDETVANWQDSQYRFDLFRNSYGPAFRLVGVDRRLEALAQTATTEAKRLDDLEAPQRDAARLASEDAVSKARLEKARLVNKAKFRL
jgi:hypothetical protein